MRRGALWLLALAWAAGCGRLDFKQARHLEDAGQSARALKAYERFLAREPGGPLETEALVRAARIYARVFDRCDRAVPLLERAARQPAAPGERPGLADWAAQAREDILSCPDFFPIVPGARWVYVDSESGGKNMRLDISASAAGALVQVRGAYYAGEERFREYGRVCEKKDWTVWEVDGGIRLPILRYPFRAGSAWSARTGDRSISYTIEEDSASVRTKAGEFSGCLKVRSQPSGARAWVYDYYCPGVGRVMMTVGVPEGEHPNTELSRYSIPRR